MKGSEIGLIVVGFFIIAILVGGGLYLYYKTRFNEHSEGSKIMKVKVTNKTPYTHTLTTPDETFEISPGEIGALEVKRHSDVSALSRRSNGEPIEFVQRLSNSYIDHLYITLDGFRTNLTSSTDVDLVNASKTDVLFIHKSLKGGEKTVVQNVPSMASVQGIYIQGRSRWIVSYPEEPDIPITELTLGIGKVSKLVFDGVALRAYPEF